MLSLNRWILFNAEAFANDTLFSAPQIAKYDYIISNPPYFKIQKSDIRAKIAHDLVYGQPNIYALFMGLASKLLTANGELIFITPRSFAAGHYFKAFRESFFSEISISNIHIFQSRNKMFKNDNVLQENIIIRATKQNNDNIEISVSESINDLKNSKKTFFKQHELIDFNSPEKILFIPSSVQEAESINVFRQWHHSLNDYNIQISTGPVVAFRCKDFFVSEYTKELDIVPLIWLHNVKKMKLAFPLAKKNKSSYIIDSSQSRKVLLENKNYILIRRFSSKDDKSRLVCSPYFAINNEFSRIGIENHLNYIYRPNGELSDEEIWGISALFNSTLFDTYFRTFNGNTQVGAVELKQLRMPPLEQILRIGKKIKQAVSLQKEQIDEIIHEILQGDHYVKINGSTEDFKRVGIA